MKTGRYLGLYGKFIIRPVAYCSKHECYLSPRDIKEKSCNWKECNFKKNLIDKGHKRKYICNYL